MPGTSRSLWLPSPRRPRLDFPVSTSNCSSWRDTLGVSAFSGDSVSDTFSFSCLPCVYPTNLAARRASRDRLLRASGGKTPRAGIVLTGRRILVALDLDRSFLTCR